MGDPEHPPCTTAGMPTTTEYHDESPDIGVIVGTVVCLVLLVVVTVILILYGGTLIRSTACCAAGGSSERRTDTGQTTEGNNGDHRYEEIQVQNQQVTMEHAVKDLNVSSN